MERLAAVLVVNRELQITQERLAATEAHALRMSRDGYSVRQISERLGIGEPHVRSLLAGLHPCGKDGCGEPHTVGRNKNGWVLVRRAGHTRRFCSYVCVGRWIAGGAK